MKNLSRDSISDFMLVKKSIMSIMSIMSMSELTLFIYFLLKKVVMNH